MRLMSTIHKSQIISQTNEAIKASEENDKKIEDLREKYNRATSQVERDNTIKQMNEVDRYLLANKKFEEGNKLCYAKNYDGAIKLYTEAIKLYEEGINPNYLESYYNVASDTMFSVKKDYTKTYFRRGCAYHDLGKYELAIQDNNKAIELNPNYFEAYSNRGLAYSYLGQKERAIQDYNKAIQINPNYFEAYNNRGFAYSELGQYEQAIQDFDKALEFKQHEFIYNGRGAAYANLGQHERAIDDFNKAIELNPNFAEFYYFRGLCYQELGENEKAQADFAKAKELGYKG